MAKSALVLMSFPASSSDLVTTIEQAPIIAQVVIFFVAWLGLWLPLALPLAIGLQWRPPQPVTPAQKLPLLVSLYLMAPLVLWGAAQVHQVPFSAFGLIWNGSMVRSLLLGLSLSTLGIGLFVALQLQFGWAIWQPQRTAPLSASATISAELADSKTSKASEVLDTQPPRLQTILLPLFLLAGGVSLIEELVFRGFLINQFQPVYGSWVGAAIASLIFAVTHLLWEGRDQVPQLPGLWLMGMVLVVARWADGGSLGIAWGLHTGWVWGMASLDTAQVLARTGQGPAWLLGQPGQPLTAGMTFGLLLITAALLGAKLAFAGGLA